MYDPIIKKIEYWKDCTGDYYRREKEWDYIITNGNSNSDTLISLWLPLRYTLNYYDCSLWKEWKKYERKKQDAWKEKYEIQKLKTQKPTLKADMNFLTDLIKNIKIFLPPQEELTHLLIKLFDFGQKKCNVMILPKRSWNTWRGFHPYYDYMPHFLSDLMDKDSTLFLKCFKDWTEKEHLEMSFIENKLEFLKYFKNWIEKEHLEMFFMESKLDRKYIRDLAGTGAPWKHSPKDINLPLLLENYIEILRIRDMEYE